MRQNVKFEHLNTLSAETVTYRVRDRVQQSEGEGMKVMLTPPDLWGTTGYTGGAGAGGGAGGGASPGAGAGDSMYKERSEGDLQWGAVVADTKETENIILLNRQRQVESLYILRSRHLLMDRGIFALRCYNSRIRMRSLQSG